jgi:hypothetical protein
MTASQKKTSDRKRLVIPYEEYDMEMLSDNIAAIMSSLEFAFETAGGEPGKDYTMLDLFKAAVQLRCAEIQREKRHA